MDLDTFRLYTEWHDHVNRRLYDAPADPWSLVSVDPTGIERCVPGIGLYGLGRVEGGAWDRPTNTGSLTDLPAHEGVRQRFEAGRDWEDTRLVEWARERFEDGDSARGYESLDAFVEQRCSYLDDLFERIREEGYRPNADAEHDNPAARHNPYEDAYAHKFEPLVAVGRSGEFLWVEGFHRLAIATVLDVDSVPVQVVCRHREWQHVRDEAAATTGENHPPAVIPHRDNPDLTDLLDGAD